MDNTIDRIPSPVGKVNHIRKKLIANCDYLQDGVVDMSGVDAKRHVFRQMVLALKDDVMTAYREDECFKKFINEGIYKTMKESDEELSDSRFRIKLQEKDQ